MYQNLLRKITKKKDYIKKLDIEKNNLTLNFIEQWDEVTALSYEAFGAIIISLALVIACYVSISVNVIPILITVLSLVVDVGLLTYSAKKIKKIIKSHKKITDIKESIDNVNNELNNEKIILDGLEVEYKKEFNTYKENKKDNDKSLKKDIRKIEIEELKKYKDVVNELNNIGRNKNSNEKNKSKILRKDNY